MVNTAQKICFKIGEFNLSAYRIDEKILFIRSQMTEVLGLNSKSSAQTFGKLNEGKFPPLVKALASDKNKIVMLSSLEAALAYWSDRAQKGNSAAIALIEELEKRPLTELKPFVVVEADRQTASTIKIEQLSPKTEQLAIEFSISTGFPKADELHSFKAALDVMAIWKEDGGLDKNAIAIWKLNQIAQKYPALARVAADAQKLLSLHDPLPADGFKPTELASSLSQKSGQTINATQINNALRALGFQEKPGGSDWKLTEIGKKYAIRFLVSSQSNGWSGAQIRWFSEVVPILEEYFIKNADFSRA